MKDYKKILIFTNKTETAEKLHLLLNKLGEETELLSSSLDHDWKRTVMNPVRAVIAGSIPRLRVFFSRQRAFIRIITQ